MSYNSSSYNREMVRTHDPDHYLISLFTPKERHESLWALYAFNLEIAKTRFLVTDTTLGQIRLQWWRDEFEKIYEGTDAPDHPVLQGLETAIRNYGLPKALFDNLIYAREFDLEDVQPQGVEGIENYADLTTTPLTKMAMQIAGEDPAHEHVQTVSIEFSLIQLIRAMPRYKANHFELVTPEILQGIKDNLVKAIEIEQAPLLKAHHKLAHIYKRQLQKVDFDITHQALNKPPKFKELRLWFSMMLNS